MSVLEIDFVGQCEVFVLILLAFFPPLAVKLIGPRTGCQFFKKNVDFSDIYPLRFLMQFATELLPHDFLLLIFPL